MRRMHVDIRRSLWDIDKKEIQIGNLTYVLEGAPDRGAGCLVYRAQKMVKIGENVYPHRVILKEFYPLLDEDKTAGIYRNEEGCLVISKATLQSEEYQLAKKRFEESCVVMWELGKTIEGAETTSVPMAFLEANGTYYVEEVFDGGKTLREMADEGELDSFEMFLRIFKKCINVMQNLHSLGYLHLDFNPGNISYTHAGNIKFFDTDTFVKKEDLDKVTVWRGTNGFSAPEIKGAAKSPEDAPFLIGEWSDVYSLTQLLCWFLFGHPLKECEVEEAFLQLEEKILEKTALLELVYQLSRSGLFRLKVFLKKNLSRNGRIRTQTTAEYFLEAEEMLTKLFYEYPIDSRVPIDNFYESTRILPPQQPELMQLQECLGNASMFSLRVTVVKGGSKKEREELARSYATYNRLKYSEIVEVHCNDFSQLKEKISLVGSGVDHLSEITPKSIEPILFIIFDQEEKDFLRTSELAAIEELAYVRWCHILIVGEKNRLLNRQDELDESIYLSTIEIETDDEDFELRNEVKEKKKTDKAAKRALVLWEIIGFLMILTGAFFVKEANEAVGPMVYQDHGLGTTVYSTSVLFEEDVWLHVLGALLMVAGMTIGICGIFQFHTPYGWKYFIKQFQLPISGISLAVFAQTMPEYFAYASRVYATWNGFGLCQSIAQYLVMIVMIVCIILWVYLALGYKQEKEIPLQILSIVLYIVAYLCILLKSWTSLGEWGMLVIAATLIYVGIGFVKE